MSSARRLARQREVAVAVGGGRQQVGAGRRQDGAGRSRVGRRPEERRPQPRALGRRQLAAAGPEVRREQPPPHRIGHQRAFGLALDGVARDQQERGRAGGVAVGGLLGVEPDGDDEVVVEARLLAQARRRQPALVEEPGGDQLADVAIGRDRVGARAQAAQGVGGPGRAVAPERRRQRQELGEGALGRGVVAGVEGLGAGGVERALDRALAGGVDLAAIVDHAVARGRRRHQRARELEEDAVLELGDRRRPLPQQLDREVGAAGAGRRRSGGEDEGGADEAGGEGQRTPRAGRAARTARTVRSVGTVRAHHGASRAAGRGPRITAARTGLGHAA